MSALWQRVARLRFAKSDFLACAWNLGALIPAVSPPVGASIRPADPADFPRVAAFTQHADFRGTRMQPNDVEGRYHKGHVCFIAAWRGEIASVSWIRFDDASLRLSGIEAPLRPGEAYVTAVFTLPAYRNRGLATAVAADQLRWLRGRGLRAAFLWVHPRNQAMLNVVRRTGWRPVGRVTQVLWRGKERIPLVNLSAVLDPADPLSLCSSRRLTFTAGVSVFRRGSFAWLPVAELWGSQSPSSTRGESIPFAGPAAGRQT